jgi:hypothetical protein
VITFSKAKEKGYFGFGRYLWKYIVFFLLIPFSSFDRHKLTKKQQRNLNLSLKRGL